MNIIALTGSNGHAMADAADLLLLAASTGGHRLSVCLYVDQVAQAMALRVNNLGRTEIWRIGADPDRAHMDSQVDVEIPDDSAALAREIENQLARFLSPVRPELAPTFN